MTHNTSEQQSLNPRLLWAVRLASLIALAAAGYLAVISLRAGGPALGCGGLPQFDCQHVLASRWSSWLGLPVGLLAAGVYALLLGATFALPRRHPRWLGRAAVPAVLCLAAMAGGAALWFLFLLAFVVRQVCLYCLLVHACALTIATLVLTSKSLRQGQTRALALAGCGLAALVAGQLFLPPPTYRIEEMDLPAEIAADASVESAPQQPPLPVAPSPVAPSPVAASPGIPSADIPSPGIPSPSPAVDPDEPIPAPPQRPVRPPEVSQPGERSVVIFRGRVTLNAREHPLLGKPDAKYVLVVMSDYTCAHCRRLHALLKEAQSRYGGELAILVLAVPMNNKCNPYSRGAHPDQKDACEYARLGLAVWLAAPAEYEKFHDWLFKGDRPPPLDQAQRYAEQLAGAETLAAQRDSEALRERLRRNVELFRLSGTGPVPKMFSGVYKLDGVPETVDALMDALRRVLGPE